MGIEPQEQQTEFACVLTYNNELNPEAYPPVQHQQHVQFDWVLTCSIHILKLLVLDR